MSGKKLSGKVAIVTGASKGIGAEVAKALAAEGASVLVNYSSSRAGAEKVVEWIQRTGAKAVAVQGDMRNEEDIRRMFAEAKKSFGRVDILVNNAGVYEFAPLAEVTPEFFHKQFDLNVLGLLLATKHAVNYFGDAGGSVINISSIVSKAALPTSSVYSATKAAVDAVTRVLAAELGPRRIRVNAVNPGMVITEGNATAANADDPLRKVVEANTPLGRIGNVDDIAPAVVFFASDDSKWISGETLYITGGWR